ncbi:hypothetical protein GOBAR_DD04765 [Gossypium barbadense]|nr:hypothetical protein GOBAR_DD04765 [Gossypium barbadense]
MATTFCDGEGTMEIMVNWGKAKIRAESNVVFPFSPKPVQVELPLFNGTDLEEWLASKNDFFEFTALKTTIRLYSNIKNEVLGYRSNSMNEVLALAHFHEAKSNETRKSLDQDPQLFLLDDELEDEHLVTVIRTMVNEGNELEVSDDTVQK